MSSAAGPIPSPASVSAAQLRRMLEQALPSDAQLDAFCIDYIPTVHLQFSDGMERTRKLNLLLASTPPEELMENLRCYSAMVSEREQALPARSPGSTVRSRGRTRRMVSLGVMLLGVLGATIGIAVLVLWLRLPSDRATLPRDPPTGYDLSAPAPNEPPVAIRTPWLTSEPPSALIYAVPSGILLGQTPWIPEPGSTGDTIPPSGVQVCLRSPGFIPVLVRLEPGADQSWPRPISVRLQREPRAAQKRDLRQESCNVPTPILE